MLGGVIKIVQMTKISHEEPCKYAFLQSMGYSKYSLLSSKVPTPGNLAGDQYTSPMIPIQPALNTPAPAGHLCEFSYRVHDQVCPSSSVIYNK